MLSNADPAPDEWLSPNAVAEEFGISPQTLANQRYLGIGATYSKLGPGRFAPVRYKRSDLDAWVQAKGSAAAKGEQ